MENNGEGEEKKGTETAVVKIRTGDTGGLVGFLVLGSAMAVVAIVTHAMKVARVRAAEKERADGETNRGVESNEEEEIAPPPPQPQSPVAAAAIPPTPLLPAPEQRLALPPPPPPHDLPPETLSSETPQRREANAIHATPTIEVLTDEAHRTLPREEERSDIDVEPQPDHDYDPSQAQHEELEESRGSDQEEGQQQESELNTESSADELSSNESNTDRWPAEASESSTTSLEELGVKLLHDPKPYQGNAMMKTVKEDGREGEGSMTTIKASDRRAINVDKLKGLVGFVSTLVAVVAVIVVMHTQQERIAENLHRLYQWMFCQDSFQQKI